MRRIRKLAWRLQVVEERLRRIQEERQRAADDIRVDALIGTLGADGLEALLKTGRTGEPLQLPPDVKARLDACQDHIARGRYGTTFAELQEQSQEELKTI
jgi:hypothetical protein